MANEKSLVRKGIVMDVDKKRLMVRVYYPEFSDIVSDWLFVPQRPFDGDSSRAPLHIQVDVQEAEGHTHDASVSYSDSAWLPKIDDVVLVLYVYGHESEGYVLGVIP